MPNCQYSSQGQGHKNDLETPRNQSMASSYTSLNSGAFRRITAASC